MGIALVTAGAAAALVALLAVVGLLLPRGHVAAGAVRTAKPPQDVWDALADHRSWPAWAPGVKAMEPGGERDGREVWRMVSRHGAMPWVIAEDDPPRRRVTRIVDEGLAFGGTWTWTIAADGAGSRVTLTEDGFVRNPVFRALARFVFGHRATIDAFLRALARRMGDAGARVERIR
jgi:polyketide cyclase/dehydrase/lipid transport protein